MPRPRSEEIPLEIIKKTSVPPTINSIHSQETSSNSSASNNCRLSSRFNVESNGSIVEVVEHVNSNDSTEISEETSFTTTSRRESANMIQPALTASSSRPNSRTGARRKGAIETV